MNRGSWLCRNKTSALASKRSSTEAVRDIETKKALKSISAAKHVQVVGTASPEGSQEINDKLSQARADVVAQFLQERGVIVDEATGKGVQGNTSNRLAVVYVK